MTNSYIFSLLKSWHANAINAHREVPPVNNDLNILERTGISNIQQSSQLMTLLKTHVASLFRH